MGNVEIDELSGFCFGVVTAIDKAEEELDRQESELYCLGDIVHNREEVDRLGQKGLKTIDYKDYFSLQNKRVLFRAHGEPPAIYDYAQKNGITIVDATCPVVLKLQQRIRQAYHTSRDTHAQIVILGKRGHAEVNGLVGQTDGNALVIQSEEEIDWVDFSRPVLFFSQTTMELDLFHRVEKEIRRRMQPDVEYLSYDTICRQVAKRMPHIVDFARRHDRIFFIAGAQSSNGKVLYNRCLEANPQTTFISETSSITLDMVPSSSENIGICGATSTSRRQMELVAQRIRALMSVRKQQETETSQTS